jgi:hypothetical protein
MEDFKKLFLHFIFICLEDTEGLLSSLGALGFVRDNIETNGFRERTALSNGDNITVLYSECRGAMGSNVLVPFLKTTVLLDVVQVVSSDNDGPLHLGRHNLSDKNSSTDGNISCEGALLVDEAALNSRIGGLDSKTYVLNEAHGLGFGRTNGALSRNEDGILLLVSLFVL